MAEESVVKEQLLSEAIGAADKLTMALRRRSDFELVASFWLYTSDENRWRLFIATPLFDSQGPLFVYNLIQNILAENWDMSLAFRLHSISVQSPNHPVVKALRSLGPFGIQDLPKTPRRPSRTVRVPRRIAHSRVQDVFVEDALIYFLQQPDS